MSTSNLEIARDILIAIIQRGAFDTTDDRKTMNSIHAERNAAISKAFKDIHKAVYESSDEEAQFWNSPRS